MGKPQLLYTAGQITESFKTVTFSLNLKDGKIYNGFADACTKTK